MSDATEKLKQLLEEDERLLVENRAVATALSGQVMLFEQTRKGNTGAVRLGLDYQQHVRKQAKIVEGWRFAISRIEALEAQVEEYRHVASSLDNLLVETDAHLKAAVEALEFIDAKICWEINPSNYDHDQVCDMNADWCEIADIACATLAKTKGGE